MTVYKLKILLKLSDPSVVNSIELTSNILNYTGIQDLEKYPCYDPNMIWTSGKLNKIRNFDYNKILETFFSMENFKKEFQYLNRTKDKEHYKENFEYTLQLLLNIGLPVNEYYQTMEYYSSTVKREKSVVHKPESFSYITHNNKKYTVIGLIWINDVFNHPVYNKIINTYQKYYSEKSETKRKKNKIELELLLNKLIINMAENQNLWNANKKRIKSENEKYVNDRIKNIYEYVNSKKDQNFFLNNVNLNNQQTKDFIDKYDNISRELKQNNNKNIKIKELVLEYRANIQDDEKKFYKFAKVDDFLNLFQETRDEFKFFLKNTKISIFENLNYNIPYRDILTRYAKQIKELLYREDMYNFVFDNVPFQYGYNKDVENIRLLLENEFPNYKSFTEQIKELYKNKNIHNKYFNKFAKNLIGKERKKLIPKENKEDDMFGAIIECKKNISSCTSGISNKTISFLNTGVDQLKANHKITSFFEAYVNVNVFDGEINTDNYNVEKCNFYNLMIGKIFRKKENSNFLKNKELFIRKSKKKGGKISNLTKTKRKIFSKRIKNN